MKSPVRSLLERRSQIEDPSRIPSNGSLSVSAAGQVVNERTSLTHIAVYRCVALIADAVSMLPLDAYRKVDGTRVPVSSSLVDQPNAEMTSFEFWQRMLTSILITGNAFAVVAKRDPIGYATQLTPIHPDDIRRIERDANNRRVYHLANGRTAQQEDMLHVPGLIRPGSTWGMSPLEAGESGIGLSMAAEQFGARWFGEGATPSSVLETDANLTAEDALAVRDGFAKAHGDGHRKPAVLSGGLKWRQVQVSPNESQFLETRRYSASEIASLYRIPPHMVGDVEKSTSWGSGIEEQGIGFVVFTIGPWVTRFEQAIGSLLPPGQFAKFNVSALLRGNAKDRMLAYAIARQWGWMSVNDIRALEDLPPLGEEGDIYLTPLNMADAEQALKALTEPRPQGGQ